MTIWAERKGLVIFGKDVPFRSQFIGVHCNTVSWLKNVGAGFAPPSIKEHPGRTARHGECPEEEPLGAQFDRHCHSDGCVNESLETGRLC